MEKSRNKTIDILRGISALSVILGHAIQRGLIVDYDSNIIFKLIYTFHMPLFVFLSGYTLFISKPKFDYDFIKKKFKRLIIPTIIWSYLIYFFKDFGFVGIKPFVKFKNGFIEYSKNLILHPDFLIWFLYIVFICTLIIYIGKRYFHKNFILYMIIINVLTQMIKHEELFGINRLKLHLPIFTIGYFVAIYRENIVKYLHYILVPVIIYYIFKANAWSFTSSRLYQWSIAFSAIIILYFFVKEVIYKNNLCIKIFSFLGKYSLELYLCQSLCLNIGIGQGILRVITIFMSAICISIIVAYITKKYSFTNKILYGRF